MDLVDGHPPQLEKSVPAAHGLPVREKENRVIAPRILRLVSVIGHLSIVPIPDQLVAEQELTIKLECKVLLVRRFKPTTRREMLLVATPKVVGGMKPVLLKILAHCIIGQQ